MKMTVVLFVAAATLTPLAMARNTEYKVPFSDVLDSPDAKARLDSTVSFYFGNNNKTVPASAESKGSGVISKVSRVSNWRDGDAVNNYGGGPPPMTSTGGSRNQKDDIADCKAAALNILVEMQQKAKQLGANAVVNLVSFYKNVTFSSATNFECHAGGSGSHVTLKAEYAVLP